MIVLTNGRRACRVRVFGTVVDKALLLRTGGSPAGLISTVGPVVIGMRPDINQESMGGGDTTSVVDCNALRELAASCVD